MNIFNKIKDLNKGKKQDGNIDFLVVGLGNPGQKYNNTRHNAGFLTLELLSDKYNINITRSKFKSLSATAEIGEKKCLFILPQTYMNKSGEAVIEAMNFYKIPIENVVVLCDDISLEPSKIRIRKKGSHGGQRGLKNIIDLTGSENFLRIKIGVGAKPHPDYDLADWVLSSFNENEKKLMVEAFEKAILALELIVNGNVEKAMNQYNS